MSAEAIVPDVQGKQKPQHPFILCWKNDRNQWHSLGALHKSQRPECGIFVGFQYDQDPNAYDSELCIRARFPRERTPTTQQCDEYQNMVWHFYGDAFCNASSDIDINPIHKLPRYVSDHLKAEEQGEKSNLYQMTITYLPQQIITQGTDSPRHFSNTASHDAAKMLHHLTNEQTASFELYGIVPGRFHQEIGPLKYNLTQQKGRRIMSEYWDNAEVAPVIRIGAEGFGSDIDKAAKEKVTWFRDKDHHAITFGIGQIREAEVELDALQKVLAHPVKASFTAARGHYDHEQLPLYYIMCVDWEDAHVMRFLPGMTGTLYLDEPLEGLPHPQGWRWTLKPQLPMDSVYGNLAFLVTRPKSEYEEIRTAPSPGTDMLRFSNYNVWLHPDTNHASARRLVDCATKLRTSTGPRWDEMRQTVQNRDQPEGKAHGLFDRATHPKAEREIDGLKESLSDGQKAAIDHIKQSKQLIAQIQGPPGTGKTTLAAAIVRTLHARRIKVACFAPTDAGVDSLANMVEAQAPHIHAIRYNSIGEESRPTVERTSQHPPANVPPEGNDAVSNLQMGVIMDDYGPELTKDHLKEQIIWAEVETDIMKEDSDWLSSNSRRFNHRTMNLSLRTMEAAGMLNQNRTIKAIKPDLCPMAYQALVDTFYGDYTLEDYAQCLESPGEQLPTSEGQRIDRMERLSAQNFGSILKAAFETRLRATTVVLTNCISAADSLLRKNFHPEVILVDEAAKASELELLLTIIHNINTVTLVVFIGDPKHSSPCVESRRVTRVDGRPFNPFAGQLAYSLMARLYESGYPTATLSEQYRMADKLCYISNELFYGGLVTNADSARMEKRESARRAVDFLRIKYNLDTDTPQLFVHVVDSVCVRTPDMSRYNAYNAIAGMSVIRDLILGEVFTAPQITVLSFHQGQCRYYREAIVRASSLPEWKGMNIDQICVRTVDSAHGSEFECVILDLVLSKLRIGGPGIVASSGRINLALTRCRSMQVTIGDIFCLEDEVAATADPGGMLEAPSWAWDTKLVRLFDIYWYQKEATITLDPNTLATKKLVDFKAAEVDRQRVKDLIKKRK